jgi:hypothetical protein
VNYIRRCFWEGAGRDLNSCGKEVQALFYYIFLLLHVIFETLCLVKIIYFLLNPDKGTNDDDEDDLLASLH